MTYVPYYPAGWVDSPNGIIPSTTPIIATSLDRMDAALLNVDSRPNGRDYGLFADTDADMTSEMQAFVSDLVASGLTGNLLSGTYHISDQIDFPNRPGWGISGDDWYTTKIIQESDDVPIFYIGSDLDSFTHSWRLENIWFDYANAQDATNVNANPLVFSGVQEGAFQGLLRRLRFQGGSWGIKVVSGGIAPWGTNWDQLLFGSDLSGGAMDWTGSLSATPNNDWGRFYVDCERMIGPVFKEIRGYNFTINTIEMLKGYLGPQLITFQAGTEVVIGAIKLELGIYTTNNLRLIDTSVNSYVQIGTVNIGGTTFTVNVSGGQIYLFNVGNGEGQLHVGSLAVDISSLAGAAYVGSFGAGTVTTFKKIRQTGGLDLTNVGATSSADYVSVDAWNNNRISPNKGNANYTVALGDPNVVAFNTPFTAQRTLALPSDGDNLFNGLYYDILFDGAINGANTALIKCGATTIRTETSDKIALRYVWRRHPTPALGWILQSRSTLP